MKRTTRRLKLEKQTIRALALAEAPLVGGGLELEVEWGPTKCGADCTNGSRRTNCNPTME